MTPGIKRALLWLGVALFAFVGFGIYQAGRDELPPPPSDTNITAPHGGDAVGERIKARSWDIRYDRMVSNSDQTVVDLYGVHKGTIYREGKPYLDVRAAHLTVNTVTHDFTALGPLHVAEIGGSPKRSFDTDSATWSDATQKLTFAHRTTIVSGAAAPMIVGSMLLDVKSGDVDVTDASGSIRFK